MTTNSGRPVMSSKSKGARVSDIRGTVRCDSCKEEIPDQRLADWVLKICPKCDVPYMTAGEVRALEYVQFLMDCGLVSQDKKKTGAWLHIDTAEMRSTDAKA
jgi:hypothetical protein